MFKRVITCVLSLSLIISNIMLSETAFAAGDTNIVRVTNSQELKTALANAKAGDEIVVAEGEYIYSGSSSKGFTFHGSADGTEDSPIIIRSEDPENPAILKCADTSSKFAFTVTGDWWEIRDLVITNAQKGIIVENSNHTKIVGCEVYNTGTEGIHFRDNSSYGLVEDCYVHDTGVVRPGYGEGVYIGSAKSTTGYGFDCHYNTIRGCRLGPNVAAEYVDVKEYTIGTVIENCIFDGTGMSGENYAKSFVNIKGNDCILRNNTGYRNGCDKILRAFEQNQIVDGWGQNALVYGNKVYMDTAINSTEGKMYFLNSWNCSVTVWDNYMAYEGDLFSVDNESDHWNYYNYNMLTYGSGEEIATAEVKYQLRPNDDGTTDIRFVLETDEREVLTVSSASLYVTFVDTGDTDSIKINRAYRSIIANGQKVSAANGKVFVTCVFGGMPDDMLDGTVVHFTLGGNTYDKTISV